MVGQTETLAGRPPVRQSLRSMAKALRYSLADNPTVQNLALHTFFSAVQNGAKVAPPVAFPGWRRSTLTS
jgi:hypothetical protein